MVKMKKMKSNKGFTLIEILVVIGIMSLTVGMLFSTMNSALSTFREAQREATAVKFIDSIAWSIVHGNRQVDGLKGALELIRCEDNLIEYVPLWKNTYYQPGTYGTSNPQVFTFTDDPLYETFRYGAGAPVLEVSGIVSGMERYDRWDSEMEMEFGPDKISLLSYNEVQPSMNMHIWYWPEPVPVGGGTPKTFVRVEWDSVEYEMKRSYNGVGPILIRPPEFSPLCRDLEIINTDINTPIFTYYGNDGVVINTSGGFVPDVDIHSITGIEMTIETEIETNPQKIRKIPIFVNLRHSRNNAAIKILRVGTKIRLEPSAAMKALKISNIAGPMATGDFIKLTVTPDIGKVWELTLNLDEMDIGGVFRTIIKSYQVTYDGNIHPEVIVNADCRQAFDLLDFKNPELDLDNDPADDDGDGDPVNENPSEIVYTTKSTLEITAMSANVRGAAISVSP